MAKKKFFNTKVKNKRKNTFKLLILGIIIIIGIIIVGMFFLLKTINNNSKNNEKLLIKQELTVEIMETITDEMFFTSTNPNLDNVTISYPNDFNNKIAGSYEVQIIVSGKKYKTKLNIVDTSSPILKLKEVVLNPFKFYTVNDFIESCTDNSGKDCILSFSSKSVNENGETINYSNYMKNGKYEIKIIATDEANNETIKTTKLTIGDSNESTPTACEYGTDEYDENNYIMASSVATNGCALSTSLYNDENLASSVNKLLSSETIKIKKDLDKLNLDGTLALNRTINVILNKSGKGMIGYELHFTATLTKSDKSEVVVEYKIDKDTNRIFIINPYKLSK